LLVKRLDGGHQDEGIKETMEKEVTKGSLTMSGNDNPRVDDFVVSKLMQQDACLVLTRTRKNAKMRR
jgi:hypothetical protein